MQTSTLVPAKSGTWREMQPTRYAVRDFVYRFIGDHGFAPSYQEIGKGIGLSSVSTVHKHVHALVKEGLLQFAGRRLMRNIRLPQPKQIVCPHCKRGFSHIQ